MPRIYNVFGGTLNHKHNPTQLYCYAYGILFHDVL